MEARKERRKEKREKGPSSQYITLLLTVSFHPDVCYEEQKQLTAFS